MQEIYAYSRMMTGDEESQNRLHAMKDMQVPDENIYTDGMYLLQRRKYDRLYNPMERVIQNSFPITENSSFIHLGRESEIYYALNNSQKESGCSFVDENALKQVFVMRRNRVQEDNCKVRL